MIDYDNLPQHPFVEKIVAALADKVGKFEKEFFRVHANYALSIPAAMMRTKMKIPGSNPDLVNMYALNLAPSGFGKGYSTSILENNVINTFRKNFLEQTMPISELENLAKMAIDRAATKGGDTDSDKELEVIQNEYRGKGPMAFNFDSGSLPAMKQLREKLIMANCGALCLQVDEVGSNLLGQSDAIILGLELYSGTTKMKLIKHSSDNKRSEDLQGETPTCMMLFGVHSALFDDGKTEEAFMNFLKIGYARRLHFGYVSGDSNKELNLPTPQERLASANMGSADTSLDEVRAQLGMLANVAYMHTTVDMPDATALLHFEYQNYCAERAARFEEHQSLEKTEMTHRYYKAAKNAAIYAFIDQAPEITEEHYLAAIGFNEECGKSFERMMVREPAHVKLANFLGRHKGEVTPVELLDKVPSYKGSKMQMQQTMDYAIDYGYQHDLIIKIRYGQNGIPFIRGESLESTNLDRMIVSHSADMALGYKNVFAPWDQMAKLSQVQDRHWITHHVELGHRSDEHCTPGFNMIVIDVDGEIPLAMAKQMLDGYKALFYTTKSHTDAVNRYRILLPTNFVLKLDKEDFKQFMRNVFEWVPFDSDEQTGQRSRKWMSNTGHFEYQEGQLFDVLPFIPSTARSVARKQQYVDLNNLDALERWVHASSLELGRNNQLHRYARILIEAGMDYLGIQDKILGMNDKLADKLTENEVNSTVMVTVAKQLQARSNQP